MKRHVWCAVFSSIVVLLAGSCKTAYDKGGLDPVSDPEYAVSDGGTMLTAVGGKERGICMLESSLHNPKDARLVTERGAISDKKLKSALRFMGYGEHIATIVGATVLTGVGVGTVVAGAPVAGAAVAITGLVGGTFGYRIVKGNIEGEKAGPIAVHSLFSSVVPYSLLAIPVVEYFHRSGRLQKVLSDKEELSVTDKRMRKLIEKLGQIYPDYPGECDHLKADLQRN